MPLTDARARTTLWALTIVALLYSAAHFAWSGVVYPLGAPNLGKFDEEGAALRKYLETGERVTIDNPVQYGAVFFFVVHPLLLHTRSERELAGWLYAIQLACVGLAFLFTCAVLKPLAPARDWTLLAAWLTVLWLNFAPVYMTIAVKSVENWELMLLAAALYAYVRERLWLMGFALAAAALVKVLPLIFFYYLLLTNRRACLRASIALLLILLAGQAIYGTDMGLGYLPHVARSAVGNSYGLRWHENLSLKAAAAKLFGTLQPPKSPYTLVFTASQLREATIVGDVAVAITMILLTLSWLRGATRNVSLIVWEWSLVSVVMLIASPNTTLEYATLALGAISYAIVRLRCAEPCLRPQALTWLALGSSMFLLGAFLPRRVLNAVTFVGALRRHSGYTHLTLSEVYQFYCIPLLGLVFLTVALWRLRPVSAVAQPMAGASA